MLRITADIDKNGFDRNLPVTPLLAGLLDEVVPTRGRIFSNGCKSKYNYLKTMRAAARPVLGEDKAAHLALRDFRHCRLNHVTATAGAPAAAYLAGHRDTETTTRVYGHADRDAAFQAVLGTTSQSVPYRVTTTPAEEPNGFPQCFPADAKGFEPPASPSGGERSIQLSYAS